MEGRGGKTNKSTHRKLKRKLEEAGKWREEEKTKGRGGGENKRTGGEKREEGKDENRGK